MNLLENGGPSFDYSKLESFIKAWNDAPDAPSASAAAGAVVGIQPKSIQPLVSLLRKFDAPLKKFIPQGLPAHDWTQFIDDWNSNMPLDQVAERNGLKNARSAATTVYTLRKKGHDLRNRMQRSEPVSELRNLIQNILLQECTTQSGSRLNR